VDDSQRPRADVVFFPLEPGAILFCPESQNLHGLNGTAALIWSGLAAGLGREDILAALADAGAPATEAVHWYADTIEMLRLSGLLEGTQAPPSPAVKVLAFGEGGVRRSLDETPRNRWRLVAAGITIDLEIPDSAPLAAIDRLLQRLLASDGDVSAPVACLTAGSAAGRWLVLRDGQLAEEASSASDAVREIETGVMRLVLEKASYLTAFRAALVAKEGHGLLLAGPSGSGKTMLAAGLMQRGWRFGGDELILSGAQPSALRGIAKSLRVNRSGWDALAPLFPELADAPVYGRVDRQVKPLIPVGEEAGSPPIRHVVICRYRPGGRSELRPLSRPDGLQALFANCAALSRPLTAADIEALVSWSGGLSFYRLTAADLGGSLNLLENLR
jgi:hypothetical protein